MKRYLIAACMFVVLGAMAYAGIPGKTEIALAGGLNKPTDGGSTWSLDGSFLFPVGPFVAGPEFGIFDSPGADGTRYGAAVELNFGKKSGLFGGLAAHKFGGDFGDVADYDLQPRFGVKFGDGNGLLKIYAQRTWTEDASGERTAPDSTDVIVGLVIRK